LRVEAKAVDRGKISLMRCEAHHREALSLHRSEAVDDTGGKRAVEGSLTFSGKLAKEAASRSAADAEREVAGRSLRERSGHSQDARGIHDHGPTVGQIAGGCKAHSVLHRERAGVGCESGDCG